jgi:hypothetical protein
MVKNREPALLSCGVALNRDISERDFTVWAVARLGELARVTDRTLGEIVFNEDGNIAIAWAYPTETFDAQP